MRRLFVTCRDGLHAPVVVTSKERVVRLKLTIRYLQWHKNNVKSSIYQSMKTLQPMEGEFDLLLKVPSMSYWNVDHNFMITMLMLFLFKIYMVRLSNCYF